MAENPINKWASRPTHFIYLGDQAKAAEWKQFALKKKNQLLNIGNGSPLSHYIEPTPDIQIMCITSAGVDIIRIEAKTPGNFVFDYKDNDGIRKRMALVNNNGTNYKFTAPKDLNKKSGGNVSWLYNKNDRITYQSFLGGEVRSARTMTSGLSTVLPPIVPYISNLAYSTFYLAAFITNTFGDSAYSGGSSLAVNGGITSIHCMSRVTKSFGEGADKKTYTWIVGLVTAGGRITPVYCLLSAALSKPQAIQFLDSPSSLTGLSCDGRAAISKSGEKVTFIASEMVEYVFPNVNGFRGNTYGLTNGYIVRGTFQFIEPTQNDGVGSVSVVLQRQQQFIYHPQIAYSNDSSGASGTSTSSGTSIIGVSFIGEDERFLRASVTYNRTYASYSGANRESIYEQSITGTFKTLDHDGNELTRFQSTSSQKLTRNPYNGSGVSEETFLSNGAILQYYDHDTQEIIYLKESANSSSRQEWDLSHSTLLSGTGTIQYTRQIATKSAGTEKILFTQTNQIDDATITLPEIDSQPMQFGIRNEVRPPMASITCSGGYRSTLSEFYDDGEYGDLDVVQQMASFRACVLSNKDKNVVAKFKYHNHCLHMICSDYFDSNLMVISPIRKASANVPLDKTSTTSIVVATKCDINEVWNNFSENKTGKTAAEADVTPLFIY